MLSGPGGKGVLEHTSEGRMTTWSLEQLGQAMGSPAAEASVEDRVRDKEKPEQFSPNRTWLFFFFL